MSCRRLIRQPVSGDHFNGVLRRAQKWRGVERGIDNPFKQTFLFDLITDQTNRYRSADDRN